jgi:hypothetical protein
MASQQNALSVSRAKTRMLAEHGIELRNQVIGELNYPLIGREWHSFVLSWAST